jgi:hypothetical protein
MGRQRSTSFALAPALLLAACAESGALRGAAAPASGPRTAADDSDPWNLVPAAADAVADVDLAALRASPWSRALVQGELGGERDARARELGYDVFSDGDRVLFVAIESAAGSRMLGVARGRFDGRRIATAFAASNHGATTADWRGSQVFQSQGPLAQGDPNSQLFQSSGSAVALVTPRTLAQGDPDTVRSAIDAAWGVVPDARGGRLGALRRVLDGDRGTPAASITVTVNDGMRARAASLLAIPPGLQQVAARLDLGNDLDLDGVAVFETSHDAALAASTWREAARTTARQPMVALLGLRAVFDGLSLTADGTRVHARVHIPANQREGLAEKLLGLLRLIAGGRR